jgi:thiol:disulfide interchange protein DsbD
VIALLAVPALARADASTSAPAFEQAIARGPLWALLAAFAGGLLVSLTPCVYPMIAITVSVFGARKAKSRGQAAALSSVFVLGIAVMFTALGLGASLSGALFGSALANKWVVGFVALVFLTLSASMFGAFDLALPSSMSNRLAAVGGIGFAGAFALGLVSALVAAPCTGPVLGGILIWIAASHRVVLGTGIMFTFALGLGVPFFAVGTFAVSLPKSGAWMLGVKWIFGVVLAVVALYFLRTAVPALDHLARPNGWFAVAAGGSLAVGLALASIHLQSERRGASYPRLSKPSKLASIVPAIAGGFAIIGWIQLPTGDLQWIKSEAEGRRLAETQRRPAIVDFGAAWCGACNELRSRTFADPLVRSEAARFVAINVDATDDEDAQTSDVKNKYGVVGLPTVVILDSRGEERVRFVEFVPPDRFAAALRSVD